MTRRVWRKKACASRERSIVGFVRQNPICSFACECCRSFLGTSTPEIQGPNLANIWLEGTAPCWQINALTEPLQSRFREQIILELHRLDSDLMARAQPGECTCRNVELRCVASMRAYCLLLRLLSSDPSNIAILRVVLV